VLAGEDADAVSSHKTWSLVKAERAFREFVASWRAGSGDGSPVLDVIVTEYDRLQQVERDALAVRTTAINLACRWVAYPLHKREAIAELDPQMAIELDTLLISLRAKEPTTPGDPS
jgi:hypothetical protein